jgi:hypothetical protein
MPVRKEQGKIALDEQNVRALMYDGVLDFTSLLFLCVDFNFTAAILLRRVRI